MTRKKPSLSTKDLMTLALSNGWMMLKKKPAETRGRDYGNPVANAMVDYSGAVPQSVLDALRR